MKKKIEDSEEEEEEEEKIKEKDKKMKPMNGCQLQNSVDQLNMIILKHQKKFSNSQFLSKKVKSLINF